MKPIFFAKMAGTGNDFLLIDNREGLLTAAAEGYGLNRLAKKMMDRHQGIGADGLILLEKADNFYFNMRYFNHDGTEAALCLNGARCLVSYAHRLGITEEKGKFMSASGPVGFYYKETSISLEVSAPVEIRLNFSLAVDRKRYSAHFLRLGVPHTVLFVKPEDNVDVEKLGRIIRNHKSFQPEGTNVNFVTQENNQLFVRTYERGVEAETMSCGSGALASAYIATKLFITQSPVRIKTRGGELVATIKDKLYLEGPVDFICEGVYYL